MDPNVHWYYRSFGLDGLDDGQLVERARNRAIAWGIPSGLGGGCPPEANLIYELCKRLDAKNGIIIRLDDK